MAPSGEDGEQSTAAVTEIVISAVAVALATALTFYMYWQYRQHWTQPRTQTYVMIICSIIPVWGTLGLLVNIFPEQRYVIKFFFDLYEGFIIIVFMTLIYWYLGGLDQAHWKAEHKEPYRCCYCFCMLYPGGKTMRFLHACIYQFAFSRPFFSLVICILNYAGYWVRGTAVYFAVTIMTFSLLFLAMWGLFNVYRIFALVLKPYNVGYKFLAIKLYIFLHALQGFVFAFAEDRVTASTGAALDLVHIEYTVVCVEMLLGAIFNTFVFFSVREYVESEYENATLKFDSSGKSSSSAQLVRGTGITVDDDLDRA
jgi:hypothetical protein